MVHTLKTALCTLANTKTFKNKKMKTFKSLIVHIYALFFCMYWRIYKTRNTSLLFWHEKKLVKWGWPHYLTTTKVPTSQIRITKNDTIIIRHEN